MAQIGLMSDVLNALSRPEVPLLNVSKQTIGTTVGWLGSYWRAAGGFPAQANIPTTAAACDDTLLGTWNLPSANGGSYYLMYANLGSYYNQHIFIYDRLAHMGGLNATLTTSQTVGVNMTTAAAASRCVGDGSDVEWFFEIYSPLGGTATTVTFSYTNQSGVSGQTATLAIAAASQPAGRMYPILITNGVDTGIKSIESLTLNASTGSAGNFGVTVGKRLTSLVLTNSCLPVKFDYATLGLPIIQDSTCLWLTSIDSSGGWGGLYGTIYIGRN